MVVSHRQSIGVGETEDTCPSRARLAGKLGTPEASAEELMELLQERFWKLPRGLMFSANFDAKKGEPI